MGDEGRKFLRYVMPGLVFGVETLVFLYVVSSEMALSIIAKIEGKDNLGIIVGAFLASGGLGYIFAAIHHWANWHLCCDKDILDHQEIVKALRKEGLLILDRETESRLDGENHQEARETAESISLSHWYCYGSTEHFGKHGMDMLGHQAHALGTARVASFFALIATVLLSAQYGKLQIDVCSIVHYGAMLTLGGIIVWVFHNSYRRVGRFAQETYNAMLMDECVQANRVGNTLPRYVAQKRCRS